jgi:uncharacterized protein (TIGR02466 family)
MITYSLFPTAVGNFNLGREFTAEEIAFVDSQEKFPNMGNTTSQNRYVLKDNLCAGLRDFIDSSISEYMKHIYSPKNEVSLKVTQSWFNYTKEGQYHHKHSHPNSFISGVLYIKADKEKDKIFFYKDEYQQIKLPTDNYNVHNSESWWLPVGTGDLMLFPSRLTHMVEPVVGEERVSMAFNTFPVGYVGDESQLTALHV